MAEHSDTSSRMSLSNMVNRARHFLNKRVLFFGAVIVVNITMVLLLAVAMEKIQKLEMEVRELRKIDTVTHLIPRTCEDYGRLSGQGIYPIEPKKRFNKNLAFHSKCNFFQGQTLIEHDHMEKVDIVPGTTWSPNYSASMENIIDLLDISSSCYQEVHIYCKSAKISGYATWTDRHGVRHEHFSRNSTNQCKHKNYCSCDYSVNDQEHDILLLDSKDSLPVQSVSYGESRIHVSGSLQIGPLICRGTQKPPPIFRTCVDYLTNGYPPGYYAVPTTDDNYYTAAIAICAYQKLPNGTEIVKQSEVGYVARYYNL